MCEPAVTAQNPLDADGRPGSFRDVVEFVLRTRVVAPFV
jgi:hypothetical protein